MLKQGWGRIIGIMPDEPRFDAEYDAIVRRETVERVDRILHALRSASTAPPWDAIYQETHSLASIAGHLDDAYAQEARNLASRLRDNAGRPLHLEGVEAEKMRTDARRFSEALHRIATANHM